MCESRCWELNRTRLRDIEVCASVLFVAAYCGVTHAVLNIDVHWKSRTSVHLQLVAEEIITYTHHSQLPRHFSHVTLVCSLFAASAFKDFYVHTLHG